MCWPVCGLTGGKCPSNNCQIHNRSSYLIADPVMSNFTSRTSCQWSSAVTRLLLKSRAWKGHSLDGNWGVSEGTNQISEHIVVTPVLFAIDVLQLSSSPASTKTPHTTSLYTSLSTIATCRSWAPIPVSLVIIAGKVSFLVSLRGGLDSKGEGEI